MEMPRALMLAAREFADRPEMVGEVLVALVEHITTIGTGTKQKSVKKLTELQRYILAQCCEVIEEGTARRKAQAERKARSRARAAREQ